MRTWGQDSRLLSAQRRVNVAMGRAVPHRARGERLCAALPFLIVIAGLDPAIHSEPPHPPARAPSRASDCFDARSSLHKRVPATDTPFSPPPLRGRSDCAAIREGGQSRSALAQRGTDGFDVITARDLSEEKYPPPKPSPSRGEGSRRAVPFRCWA